MIKLYMLFMAPTNLFVGAARLPASTPEKYYPDGPEQKGNNIIKFLQNTKE